MKVTSSLPKNLILKEGIVAKVVVNIVLMDMIKKQIRLKSNMTKFKAQISEGIPNEIPQKKEYDHSINHAPKRKQILSNQEKQLALRNALRYFPESQHEILAEEFSKELNEYGRIYMYRYRPDYEMKARSIEEYPGESIQAKAIMLMIQNNLDYAVAQHPHELITVEMVVFFKIGLNTDYA